MMMHLTTRNTKNIMSTTPRNTIMTQTLMNKHIWRTHTNMIRNIPRKLSLQEARMTIKMNDGPVSRPWKANLS
jgi:hypothetical protein